jgi:lysophospholipase L1-like esterase
MEDYRSSSKSLDPLFTDGLHLSSAGYALVNDILFPLIEATDVVQRLKQPFPDWTAALPPQEETAAN